MGKLRLELISSHPIRDPGIGLNEPSGLSLNADGTALYTVSDDTKAIFCMDLEGRVSLNDSFFIPAQGLEGIAISSDGTQLLAVQEETNSLITVDIVSRRDLHQRPLSAMAHYGRLAAYFPDPPDNKGLEGITVNTTNEHVFVVKEAEPGLLIELDAACSTILSSRQLTEANGFSHPKLGTHQLDFSDLSYDRHRDTLWITSDKGQCVFHYDWHGDAVLQRLDLVIKPKDQPNDKPKRIRKAEGIAIDPDRGRVYVVSDRDARLYVFKLHDSC